MFFPEKYAHFHSNLIEQKDSYFHFYTYQIRPENVAIISWSSLFKKLTLIFQINFQLVFGNGLLINISYKSKLFVIRNWDRSTRWESHHETDGNSSGFEPEIHGGILMTISNLSWSACHNRFCSKYSLSMVNVSSGWPSSVLHLITLNLESSTSPWHFIANNNKANIWID